MIVGAYYGEGPPVPIPNTEVKLTSAHDTWLATAWENKSVPTQKTTSYEVVFLSKENHSLGEWFKRSLMAIL